MNFFVHNLLKGDISNEVPNVHVDKNGIITQANELFHKHFPHLQNSKINDIIKLKRIDNINYCVKNGYIWKIVDTEKNKNYIIFLIPQIDITPDLWNIITIPMLLIDKDGIVVQSNKAYDIQFAKPKMEFVGQYCHGLRCRC